MLPAHFCSSEIQCDSSCGLACLAQELLASPASLGMLSQGHHTLCSVPCLVAEHCASPWSCCLCSIPWQIQKTLGSCLLASPGKRLPHVPCPSLQSSGFSLMIKKSLCWGGKKANERFVERMKLFEVRFTSAFAWPPYTVFVLVLSSNKGVRGQGEVDQEHPGYQNIFLLLMVLPR